MKPEKTHYVLTMPLQAKRKAQNWIRRSTARSHALLPSGQTRNSTDKWKTPYCDLRELSNCCPNCLFHLTIYPNGGLFGARRLYALNGLIIGVWVQVSFPEPPEFAGQLLHRAQEALG